MIDNLPVDEALAGAVGAAAALGVSLRQPRAVRRPMLLWSAVVTVFSVGLDFAPGRLLLALVPAFATTLSRDKGARVVGASIAVCGFAGVLPGSLGSDDRIAVALVTMAATSAAALTVRREPRRTVVIMAAAAVAAFLAVPDTERIGLVGGAILVVAAVMIVRPRPLAGAVLPTGIAVATSVVVWAAAVDSRGRPASFWAVVGPLALLVVFPMAERMVGRRAPLWSAVVVAGGAAVFAGRVSALRSSTGTTLVLTAVAIAASIGLALAAVRTGQRESSRS
ncbi:MAG: hypothetical protein OEU32_01925 [Acidimicrobiia bacterium]|nr:hypothetical protein [Acidimicrobiia bacterium]